MSTDHRPSVDQLLTDTSVKYRPTINQLSAKCRRRVGERKAISAETHLERLSTNYRPLCRPTVDRVSTECRPSVDRVSTDYRPSVDRVSTDCRPLYRPISRSTLPTVNKIPDIYEVINIFDIFKI